MINSIEDLRSGGILPTGPVSAWPKERNVAGPDMQSKVRNDTPKPTVKLGAGQMAKNLFRTGAQAIKHGGVSKEVQKERYDTCKSCPAFMADSKRCSECGCFMEAKTWVGGDPDKLCPLKKWSR